MSLVCCESRSKVSKARKIDPTHTLLIRKGFVRAVRRRFRALINMVKEAVKEKDVFGLEGNLVKNISPEQFKFTTSQEKIQMFMTWLNEMEMNTILEAYTTPSFRGREKKPWTDIFILSAYRKGIVRAATELKRAKMEGYEKSLDEAINLSLHSPFHADRVGILYERTFSQLKGIDDEMDKQISSVLAEGLVEGISPTEMTKNIVGRITSIGINRATTLARTEVIRAHAEANLNEFKSAGLEGVTLQVEWLTAGGTAEDDIKDVEPPVCPLCQEQAKKSPMTIEEARGLIPFHPNCRCTWIPYLKS